MIFFITIFLNNAVNEAASQAPKAKKTKNIRKIQNSSGYGVEVSQVTVGENLTENNEEEDQEEEEEVPDNLTTC